MGEDYYQGYSHKFLRKDSKQGSFLILDWDNVLLTFSKKK